MNKKTRCIVCFAALIILAAVLLLMNIYIGSVGFSFSEITEVIFGQNKESTAYNIVNELRIPRAIAAAVLGGALAVSGFLLQTFFANPIAGPFVLGISSGAKLVVALTMIVLLERGIAVNSAAMIVAAFVGAMLSMALILPISGRAKNSHVLIVCGVMIGYICSAITEFTVTFADESDIVNLHNWSQGSFSGIDSEDVAVMTAVVFPVLVIVFLMSKQIGAYQLGEAYAKNMGVNIRMFRAALILLSSVLSACVTAFAGPISFVGIAAPHIVKGLFKTAKPQIIIPASFLGGAVFCLFCDLLARMMFSPVELSISSVTAVFGAPVVIWIMLNRRRRK